MCCLLSVLNHGCDMVDSLDSCTTAQRAYRHERGIHLRHILGQVWAHEPVGIHACRLVIGLNPLHMASTPQTRLGCDARGASYGVCSFQPGHAQKGHHSMMQEGGLSGLTWRYSPTNCEQVTLPSSIACSHPKQIVQEEHRISLPACLSYSER